MSQAIVGGVTTNYTYYADGLRRTKTTNGVTTVHMWDGDNIIADLDGNYALKTGYARANDLSTMYNADGDEWYYIMSDRGDTIQMYNDTTETNYLYDAYGNQQTETTTDINPFRYCGEYYDAETGFIYLRARYYDPTIGRFISEDPIRDGLNWYAYANNNPVMFVDPSGEISISIIIAGISFVLKAIDYAWTAWDVASSAGVLASANSNGIDKILAAANIAMSVSFEAIEPDDFLPASIPLDDFARKSAIRTLEKKLKTEGPVAAKNHLKKQFGNSADEVVKIINQTIDASIDNTGSWAKGSYDTIKDSLIDHFYRHGESVGAKSVDNYLDKAQQFASNLKRAKKYNVTGYTEGAVKYVKNGRYIILDPNKNILSFGTVQ